MGERFRRGLTDGFHVGYGQFVTHADWTTFTSALGFGDDHSESAATPAEMLPYVTEAFTKAHEHRECERMAEEESCRVGECDHDEHPPPAVPDPTMNALSETERAELEAHFGDHQRLNSQGVCATCHGMAAVERILAARAAAPDALRVRIEALLAEWDAECEHDASAQCKGCAALRRAARMLRALLEDDAQ